nr:hypothetical protein [uncultured Blautia sp.]
MKKRQMNSFTCFMLFLIALILFFFLRLTYGMQEEKQQYSALISLEGLSYDQDFLKTASKLKGLQEIWPVAEIPVTIKIDDYTKTTVFNGIDLNAFTGTSALDTDFGNTPLLLLGNKALENMKDSNGHLISKKQQEIYLKLGDDLKITYSLTEGSKSAPTYLPCKAASVLPIDEDQIYIPISRARSLCSKASSDFDITKVFVKINGKSNFENVKHLIGE